VEQVNRLAGLRAPSYFTGNRSSKGEPMNGRGLRLALIASACVCLSVGQHAAAETLGIVLLHGKQGTPAMFERMASGLESAGYLAERPELCWSRERIYDLAYLDCFRDLDAAVVKLKARGATAVVIAGQSLGGNGALGYGAHHAGLKGIVAFAPAHAPQFISHRPLIAESIEKARAMLARGEGDNKAAFNDVNTGANGFVEYTVNVTPKVYLSFFAPDCPAIMPANAAKLTAPLLMISGRLDETQRGAYAIFQAAPANPLNRFVSVEAGHMGTPAAGREAMVEWLKQLAAK
jgi:esterase/lipase